MNIIFEAYNIIIAFDNGHGCLKFLNLMITGSMVKYRPPSELELDFVLLDQNLIVHGKFLHACMPWPYYSVTIKYIPNQSLTPKTHSSPATQSLIPMH